MLTAARLVVLLLTYAPLPILASLSLAGAGCAQATGAADGEPVLAASTTKGVVIAQLVTHDANVAIVGNGGGSGDLRVVIRKLDGTMVADGIGLADLQTRDPELYDLVTSSYVDARVDLEHLN
jgi:hypothetical protein